MSRLPALDAPWRECDDINTWTGQAEHGEDPSRLYIEVQSSMPGRTRVLSVPDEADRWELVRALAEPAPWVPGFGETSGS